jgi:hypothetical protein
MADMLGIMQYMDQIKQTEEAKQKEAERVARIKKGMTAIERLFEGSPIMGTRKKNIDFSGLTEKAGVGGYTVKKRTSTKPAGGGGAAAGVAAPPAVTPTDAQKAYMPWLDTPNYKAGQIAAGGVNPPGGQSFDDSSNTWVTGTNTGGGAGGAAGGGGIIETVEGYDLLDANGKVVASGKSLDDLKKFQAQEDEKYDTGKKSGGIGEDLYSKYRNAQKDYYFPQLTTQYQDAKKKLLFDHINAGTTLSSMAGDNLADVEGQKVTNTSQINSQIEDSVGALKRQVASDKQALINQLYATEDPTMIANAATAKVGAINTQQPALNPVGEFFKLAAIGGGSALQGFGNASTYGNVQPYRGINTSAGKQYS